MQKGRKRKGKKIKEGQNEDWGGSTFVKYLSCNVPTPIYFWYYVVPRHYQK